MTLLALVASFLVFLLVKQLQTDSNIRYVRATASLPSETKPQKKKKIDIDVNEVRKQLDSSKLNVEEDGQSAQSNSPATMSIEGNAAGAQDRMAPIPDGEAKFAENAVIENNINEVSIINPPPPADSPEGPTSPTEGKVVYKGKELSYYQCGPRPLGDLKVTEIVLLHGAAYTKEDWAASGILQMLCDINKNGGRVSITAWDLSSAADGMELVAAFDAMTAQSVISGRPVTMVTPSASGKALVNLAALKYKPNVTRNDLARIVKGWIAVAPPAVVHAQDIVLHQFKALGLPTLAINGDRDENGRKATKRLINLNGAKGLELPGPHAVYLESPTEFVEVIVQFLVENGL